MPSQLRAIVRRLTQHRSTRLTSEGLQFLLFTLAVGVAAINTGNNLFYLLLAMMLSIILISGIVAEHCLRRLEFHRHLPELLFANEPTTATLVMKNRKSRLPSFSLRVFDVSDGRDLDRGLTIRQLLPGTSQMLSYPLIATRRGRLQLDGVRVVTSFPFGLFVKKAYYPVEGMAVVCPEIKPLADGMLQDLLAAGQEHNVHRRGHGNDLYNLRLYHSGDDSRNIHWATTARTSKLMVRETEAEDQRRATIHLSTLAPATHNTVFEEAVTFTASLVHHFANRGYHLQLVAGSSRSSFGQGEAHLINLLRILALCERRSPNMDLGPQDDPFTERQDVEEGALIDVRPWEGAEVLGAENPTLVIDAASFAGTPHVL
ncbi:MAG: hypothetical protein EWM72_00255 [Nitrospira sp.]|nr:MAG: hypothetical protein EWM72_00255 [Nitrospira sp.]